MTTYSVRCRSNNCRHRRVVRTHPDDYKIAPKCLACGSTSGWRIEDRGYNRRNLCQCGGPHGRNREPFPHKTTHPFCDQHPRGFYNQAKRSGALDEDIPVEFGGLREEVAL